MFDESAAVVQTNDSNAVTSPVAHVNQPGSRATHVGQPGSLATHVGHAEHVRERTPAANTNIESDWRVVDRELRACARRRAALDADEARWLVAAERLQLHRRFGCASLHEYLERVLGHAPRVARDRLRVARALAELPAMSAALASGALCHSAVRELTRVATPATERAWIETARGKCLREIEDAVAGHDRGDHPDAPADAPPRLRTIELELSPSTLALYREALRHLERTLGEPLTDDAALALMCRATLDAAPAPADDHDDNDDAHDGRGGGDGGDAHDDNAETTPGVGSIGGSSEHNVPPYQIAITVCSSCERGWQDAGGRPFALSTADLARASCDAHVLDRVDGDTPPHVTRTIPPAIRRQIFRRDRGRCIVPGCRSTRHLEVHHVIPRAAGGTHDPRQLALLCFGHHQAVHSGRLGITGAFPAFAIRRAGATASSPPHVGHEHDDTAHACGSAPPTAHVGHAAEAWSPATLADARATLQAAGFTRSEAGAAVASALAHVDASGAARTLEAVVRAALRALRPRQ